MLKLSIITINYNNLPGLQKTMQSVFEQSFTDYEYIIIDGGSTDGSAGYIAEHAGKLKYWISEKDKGIYNAHNKGIKKATGEYCLFLNSGDIFWNEFVTASLMAVASGVDIVYGDIVFRSAERDIYHRLPSKLSFDFFTKDTIPHPVAIIRRELFEKYGLYREDIKISADWAFFVDAICRHNASYLYFGKAVCIFELGGLSSQPGSLEAIDQERQRYLDEVYPLFTEDYQNYRELKNNMKLFRQSRLLKMLSLFSPKLKAQLAKK